MHPGPEEELAWIRRAARGDHEAFRLLVITYERALLAYLTQMLGDRESARDIAQETFITIFHTLSRWQPPDSSSETARREQLLAPWLYRIASNLAISLLRKRQVRQRVHAAPPVADDEYGLANRERGPIAFQESFEERFLARALLEEALSQLSEIDAACLVLHYVSGERYQEIGDRLGLSSGAVRKRVMRALIVLRKTYFALDTEVRP